MSRSPAHYLASIGDDDGRDSLAMRIGRGAHALLFGQAVTVYDGIRRGKAWDEFRAEHDGVEILNKREHLEASGMALSVLHHPDASALLFARGVVHEQRLDWELNGRACRSTPDARTDSVLVDLKTSKSSAPDQFGWHARSFSYHGQLAFYRDAIRSLGIGTADEIYIVAVESARPYPVTVFRVTERSIEAGRRAYRAWFEQLLVCEENCHWPGYAQRIVDLDIDDDPVDSDDPFGPEDDETESEAA
jgi:hypothetical protein